MSLQAEGREQSFDFVIVGGGAAGVSCAETLRRKNSLATIAIVTAENELPYSRVMLPEYVKGEVKREEVFLRTRDKFVENNITIITGRRIIELSRESKWVVDETGEKYHFGKLCIATGGEPKVFDGAMGNADAHAFRLNSIADADELREAAERFRGQKWIIVGGGFIAIEIASIAHHFGSEATLLAPKAQLFLGKMTAEGAGIVADALSAIGIKVVYDARATGIVWSGNQGTVQTARGDYGPGPIGIGIGLERNQVWFGMSAKSGGVPTTMSLQTTHEDIFAAGDVAVRTDSDGHEIVLGNWASAVQTGMIAGSNMTGSDMNLSIPGIYSIHAGSIHLSFVGDFRADGAEIIARVISEASRVEFGFRGGILTSVVLMNANHELGQCIRLLNAHATLDERSASFSDASVNLASL